jgi:catechol 2,3-dioxygenase-like lactoylglutathione lyase family enzyme
MFCSIESVTLGVCNVESALKFFRDEMGLRVVNDTRASVGLLGAWRRPVHESVRLVDLVRSGPKASLGGRIRLALFEDCAQTPPSQGGESALRPPNQGPWALDLRAAGNTNPPALIAGPDGLPILSSTQADPSAPALSGIWIASSDLAASTRFYAEALGLSSSNESDTSALIPSATITQRVSYHSADAHRAKIIAAHFAPGGASAAAARHQPAMSVGQVGFNLITVRCDDLDELEKRLERLAIAPLTQPTHVGMPSGYPGRVMIAPGPNGELFEFDEITV